MHGKIATSNQSKKMRLTSLEVFSGAGGLAIGSHLSGCKHLGLIEWDSNSCKTLETNAKKKKIDWNIIKTDVQGVDFQTFGEVDMVLGGPPCQPFSLGGKHKGKNDLRDMLPEFARSVKELKPKSFVMENVISS